MVLLQRIGLRWRGEGVDLSEEVTSAPEGDSDSEPPQRHPTHVDDHSFDEWVNLAAKDLLRFATVTAGNVDAADLVQDALAAVYARWSRLKDRDRAFAYAPRSSPTATSLDGAGGAATSPFLILPSSTARQGPR